MANVLQQTGRALSGHAASTTFYLFAGSGPSLVNSTTESERQVIVRMIFTASRMYVNVTANDRGASTVRMRKNGANGNEVVAITASTTGKFEDAINTDVFASGDLFNYQLVTGAGGSTFVLDAISHISAPSVNTFQRNVTNVSAALGNNDFYAISGVQTSSNESGNQNKIYGAGGTLKNLAVFISANTRDANCTVTLRKNGMAQAMTVTIPTLTTGTFEDLVNTVAVVANDLVNWISTRPGTTGNCICQYMAVTFETTNDTFLMNGFGSTSVAAASTMYYVSSGSTSLNSATESNAQSESRIAFTLNNLRVFVNTNNINDASTVRFRKNGANGNLNVSITGLTAGAFEDVANSDAVLATDIINSQIVAGATGTTQLLRNITYLATVASATTTNQLLPIMGIGR